MPIPLILVVDSDAYEQAIPLPRISPTRLDPLMRVSDSMRGQGRHPGPLEQAIPGALKKAARAFSLAWLHSLQIVQHLLADFQG
jgi:hypothetical protein